MKIEKRLKLGIYRHYKGNIYQVLSTGRDSETEEWMVIYRTLYGDGSVWVRSFDMFTENVEVDGEVMKRFTYMGKEEKKPFYLRMFPFLKWKQT